MAVLWGIKVHDNRPKKEQGNTRQVCLPGPKVFNQGSNFSKTCLDQTLLVQDFAALKALKARLKSNISATFEPEISGQRKRQTSICNFLIRILNLNESANALSLLVK